MSQSDLETIIRQLGPCSSTRARLQLERGGLSAAAGRKRIQRARDPVRKFGGLRLPRSEHFLYLRDQLNTDEFWDALLVELIEWGSVYGFAARSLEARGGIVPAERFHAISGSPLCLKRHLRSADVLNDLIRIGLLEHCRVPYFGDCVAFASSTNLPVISPWQMIGRQLAEEVLLDAIASGLRRLGFASHNRIELRARETHPQVGQFRWDLSGPVYVNPLQTLRHGKPAQPGFVVADVVLGQPLSLDQIRYFVHKSSTHRMSGRQRPHMAILIAEWFQRDALRHGRSQGLLLCTPRDLFGSKVAAALKDLINTLSAAATGVIGDVEVFAELMSSFGKIEGSLGRLRGAFFELIVAYCVREVDGNTVDVRRGIVDSSGNHAEIDVLRVKGRQEVCAYECKGKLGGSVVGLEEVKDWCTRQIPRIRSWMLSQQRFSGCKLRFEFWTTGTFSDDAASYLSSRAKVTQRYRIGWMDGLGVRKYVSGSGETAFVRLLDEHYLRAPFDRV